MKVEHYAPSKGETLIRNSKWANRSFNTVSILNLRRNTIGDGFRYSYSSPAPIYSQFVDDDSYDKPTPFLDCLEQPYTIENLILSMLELYGKEGQTYQEAFDSCFCEEMFVEELTKSDFTGDRISNFYQDETVTQIIQNFIENSCWRDAWIVGSDMRFDHITNESLKQRFVTSFDIVGFYASFREYMHRSNLNIVKLTLLLQEGYEKLKNHGGITNYQQAFDAFFIPAWFFTLEDEDLHNIKDAPPSRWGFYKVYDSLASYFEDEYVLITWSVTRAHPGASGSEGSMSPGWVAEATNYPVIIDDYVLWKEEAPLAPPKPEKESAFRPDRPVIADSIVEYLILNLPFAHSVFDVHYLDTAGFEFPQNLYDWIVSCPGINFQEVLQNMAKIAPITFNGVMSDLSWNSEINAYSVDVIHRKFRIEMFSRVVGKTSEKSVFPVEKLQERINELKTQKEEPLKISSKISIININNKQPLKIKSDVRIKD